MKLKKVLKFAIPAIGITALGVSLPLALTSCSNSNSSDIKVTANLSTTSYYTATEGVVLKVAASLNGSTSGLGFKWYYKNNKPNAVQDNSSSTNPAPIMDGFKPVSDQPNDPDQLTIPANKLIGTNLSFRCAIYNLNDHSDFVWSNTTTPVEATKVDFNSQTLTKYIQDLPPSDLINAFKDQESTINTIVSANCGLSANQIKSVEVTQQKPNSSFSALSGANDNAQQISITINLNDAYQFAGGSRSSTINNVTTQIIYSSINQNNLNEAITKLETQDKTFDTLLASFNTTDKVQAFFKSNPNIGIDSTKITSSSAQEVDENDGYRHIQLQLSFATGYYIDGKSSITLDLKSKFYVPSVANYFTVDNSGLITGLTEEGKKQSSLIIPAYSYLTGIGKSAFSLATSHSYTDLKDNELNKTLTSITFEGTNITQIQEGAFDGCINLTSINLPSSLTTIGSYAFKETGLTSVVIPNSVTNIGDRAFYKCKSMTSLSFSGPVNELTLGVACFSVNQSLTTVTLPEGLTNLSQWALNYNNAMTTVSLPSTLTTIGNAAISENAKLTNLDLSKTNVTTLEPNALSQNPLLENVQLPNTLKDIGINAFYKCVGLKTIDIPASVQTISTLGAKVDAVAGAFTGCSSLTNVNFLAGTKAENPTTSLVIGQYAFNGCSSLKTITLPSNVTEIQSQAFNDCKALTTINITSTANFNPWKLAFYNIGSSKVTVNVPNQTIKNKIESVCSSCMTNVSVTYPSENKEHNAAAK